MPEIEVKTRSTQKTEQKYDIAISQSDLIDILFMTRHTTFIGFNSVTTPDMKKTDNPFSDKVEKHSTVNALTSYQYERMVNNAQKRQLSSELKQTMINNGVPMSVIDSFENDLDDIVEMARQEYDGFESEGLKWGDYMVDPKTGMKSRVLIDHTKSKTKTVKGEKIKVLLPETYRVYAQVAIMHTKTPVYKWIETGEELSENEIAEMKQFFPDKKEGERQGLKKPYIIRSYALDSFKSILINKNSYVMV